MNESKVAFQKLHPRVQRVVYQFGWTALRTIQVLTIEAFFGGLRDLLLVAPTAAGKTEAWVLPTLSVLTDNILPSVQVLAVSPLRALINDQQNRIQKFAAPLNIPVCGWHGDVSQYRKQAVKKVPRGIVIITPESLESMIMNRQGEAARLFNNLQFVVVDEVHALLEEERGMHVRSLLARLYHLIEHRPRMFGLSATIGDPAAAQSFINPDDPNSVCILGL